jgi:hypothetical protein
LEPGVLEEEVGVHLAALRTAWMKASLWMMPRPS